MAQQIINIGAAPDDSTGDPLRTSFDKTNDNFTELYAKGATEGLWNYNKTSTDTSTDPVSGRFKTNSGNYRDATQIAIHAITIQGIDRTSTLRAMLVGDIVQCQDSTNSAAWCRYSLQSLPVDHGTWFQLNVALQTDGGVTSGDNQEIVFDFTAGSGGSIDLSAYATLASPTFTDDPKAPTPTSGDNDTSIATTAFVTDAVSNASGGAGTAEYNFSTITTPPPNTGDVRVNNATASAATLLWVNNITRLGTDIKRMLQQIQIGSKIVIQDKGNSVNYASFQVIGTLVDQTTYWEIPVMFLAGAGTVANNARILLGVQQPGGAGNVSNSGAPTVGQYAKWVTATTIQGVAPATVLSDIGAQPAGSYQPLDGELTAIAGLTSAADQVSHFTGSGTAALMTVTAAARTVLDDTSTAAMLTTLGGAPVGAEYITSTADATLTAERVLTDTASVTWDRTTAGQIKANAAGAGAVAVSVQKFTASGTYTPLSGMTFAIIECLGAGGAGGGTTGASTYIYCGAGGGSGGYSRKLVTAADIGASKSVTIGAAGTGSSGAAGGNGGDTSVGSLCIAKGGIGGSAYVGGPVPVGGAGGIAGTGDLTAAGAPGGPGSWCTSAAGNMVFNTGGSSAFGGGATNVNTNSSLALAGNAASNYGSGGGGAVVNSAVGSAAGGNGSAGFVIITEYK